jgi:hypothetical protein
MSSDRSNSKNPGLVHPNRIAQIRRDDNNHCVSNVHNFELSLANPNSFKTDDIPAAFREQSHRALRSSNEPS